MNNPALYAQTNRMAHTIAQEFLKKYIPLVRWRQHGGGSAMEVGCGPGNVTEPILLPMLPESHRELVATDISPQMIQYARHHHQHPRIIYDVLDITTKNLPQDYFKRFDQVFSFLCFHFVHDHRQAMENIFDMLQPGGDILLVHFIKNPIIDVMLKVASFEHWKPYIKEPGKNVGVHYEMENAEELLYSLLQEVGFEDITCESRHREFVFENMTSWTDLGTAVNAFIPQLPVYLREKHRQEFCNELKNKAIMDGYIKNDKKRVCPSYTLINIHARKPQAMENIFDMLQPGGDILLVHFIKNPIIDVMLKVASFEHWKPYINEPRKNVGVLHEMENAEELLYSLLEEVGFEDITCESRDRQYVFENMTSFVDIGTAVNSYISQLPEYLREKHRQEFCNELKNKAISDGYINNDKKSVCFPYTLINIHARKP